MGKTILVIDSCHTTMFVGLFDDESGMYDNYLLHHGRRDFDKNINRLVRKILEKNKILFKDLAAYAVVTGPGSWTGCRVGVSATLGFALGTPRPIIELNSLDIIAYPHGEDVALHCYANQYYTLKDGVYAFGEIDNINDYTTMEPYVDEEYRQNLESMVSGKFANKEFIEPEALKPNYIAEFEPNKKRN